MIIANFECCKIIIEAWRGDQITCPKCKKIMLESYGGRANKDHKDFRFRDQSTN